MIYLVGEGRYGKVYKAYYQGTWMAVKVFLSKDEENYEKERRLYMDIHLRHDNILAFRDCDMTSVNSVTQFLILTEYHPHGKSSYTCIQALLPAERYITTDMPYNLF